ncbi:MAG TPA: hypothetical protein VFJ72_16325 [Rubrobacteraceae bacterium]|nr:hypothetical protein [Rubrobacteraceae bacterium]
MKKLSMSLLLAVVLALALASVAFAQGGTHQREFRAKLATLNQSGATGVADLTLRGRRLEAEIKTRGLEPNLHHLQHIHGMAQAISECPTLAADTDGDGLVSVAEGAPFYGPIQVSFTETGDTSAASGGALDRFPLANAKGRLDYSRTFRIPADVAANVGDFAIVQHGVDLNGNGSYDNAMEVSLPATCGKIVRN